MEIDKMKNFIDYVMEETDKEKYDEYVSMKGETALLGLETILSKSKELLKDVEEFKKALKHSEELRTLKEKLKQHLDHMQEIIDDKVNMLKGIRKSLEL